MTDDDLLLLLHDTADAVAAALRGVEDWGPSGLRDGQYAADLRADAAALAVLRRAGVGVLSEESGLEHPDRPLLVVMDPLDGSTNASRRVPWFATALCAMDADGPRVGLVANQADGTRYHATRGGGAWCGDRRLVPSGCTEVSDAIVAINGYPPEPIGWAQYRAFGAAAIDFCLVADGVLDGYLECAGDVLGVWDYAAAALICAEAGAVVADAFGRDLFVRDPALRRTPVGAATPQLLDTFLAARRRW